MIPQPSAPKWASALFAHGTVAGHYVPASTLISGAAPKDEYKHAFNYKSTPAATMRYLRSPYRLPRQARTTADPVCPVWGGLSFEKLSRAGARACLQCSQAMPDLASTAGPRAAWLPMM